MFFDFDDYRPDTPRVAPVISVREGVLLSLIVHLLFVVALLLLPKVGLFQSTPAHALILRPDEAVRFVQMEPIVDRTALPNRPAEQSDHDRRSATRERAPQPDNAQPLSRGNTPEKVEGAPSERARGEESAAASPPNPRPEPNLPSKSNGEPVAIPSRPVSSLGDSLRNLQRYLQQENFDNRRGGLTDQDPDIQFDAKGVEFGPWIRRFVAQVKRNWFIPYAAMSLHGRVVLQFNVLKDGRITDLRIVDPSSVESFTSAAFNALQLSNPTLPLPAEYPSDKAFFTVTFHYNEGIRHED